MDSIRTANVHDVRLSQRKGLEPLPVPTVGSLHITLHHLIFRSEGQEEIWIPLPLLYSVHRHPPNHTATSHPLTLRTRTFQVYELSFVSADAADAVFDSLKSLSSNVAQSGLEGLYAFFNLDKGLAGEGGGLSPTAGKGKRKGGWGVYNVHEELERMGVGSRSKAWRVSTINADYEFCPTYPAEIIVPAKISDSTLSYAVKYRSKGRIPGLVYLHWANLGSITRSSQPMVGLKNARSIQDEKLIETIFHSHAQHSTLPPSQTFTLASSSSSSLDSQISGQVVYGAQATNLIIDARPTTNAMANSVKGAGSENMEYYKGCKKAYLGIDNIHVMRASLTGIYDALRESETTGHLDRTLLRRTNWLKHLANILEGILLITRTIHLSNSHVLVHCSDGWDRTSQLSSLAQLCLDPYYRTGKGLAVLIEKDWLSYGHRFSDRTGHLCADRVEFEKPPPEGQSAQQQFLASVQKQFSGSSHAYKETCPVFHQFLDCIYQLLRQFPDRFEFGEGFLRKVYEEIYSNEAGTFLFNSEKERVRYRAKERTKSVWEGLLNPESGELLGEFKNPLYDKELDDPDSRTLNADQGVLMLDPQDVKWWWELLGRTDEEMNGKPEVEGASSGGVGEDELSNVVIVDDGDTDVLASGGAISGVKTSAGSVGGSGDMGTEPSSGSGTTTPAGISLPSQVQLVGAVSSVQKFGWGAWKAAQKGYKDAVTQYRDSATSPSPSSAPSARSASPASRRPPPSSASAHSRTVDGGSLNSGWKAGDGEELGTTKTRPPASAAAGPQASRQSAYPYSPYTSTKPPASAAAVPSQPRPSVAPPAFDSLSISSPISPAAPARVPAPEVSWSVPDPRKGSKSANPWDRPSSPVNSSTTPVQAAGAQEKKSGGNDVDPLGVGFA